MAKNGLQNTQVVLTGTTPGGEYKVASPAGAARYSQANFGGYQSGDNYDTQPQLAQASSNVCLAVLITTARGITDNRGLFTSSADIDDGSGALAGVGGRKLPCPCPQNWPVACRHVQIRRSGGSHFFGMTDERGVRFDLQRPVDA